MDIVSSIDSFLPDRHFPSDAPADLVGYRAIMASFSDLAAMGAPSEIRFDLANH